MMSMTSSLLHGHFGRMDRAFGTCGSLEKPKGANVFLLGDSFSLEGANVTLERGLRLFVA
jgi:hypothetical protein